jgi:hypothetical protein
MDETIEEILKSADELYENNKFFEASFAYQSAIKKIQGQKVEEVVKNHIKDRLKECIGKSDSEFKTFSTETHLDEAMIAQINEINQDALNKVGDDLKNFPAITFSTTFICSAEKNKETAKKTIPITYQIANVTNFSKDGYLSGNNEDYTPLELWSFETYEMEQLIKVQLHINPIFKKLTNKGIFTTTSFEQLLSSKGLSKNIDDLYVLKQGVNTYILKDYTSAIHIIIPQLENLLLIVFENAGIQTSVIERGKTITKRITLSDRELQGDSLTKLFGKDYCAYLRYVLYSPLGLSLRHKVAHGTIEKEECSESNCNLVLVALFVLLHKIQKITPPTFT